MSFLFTAFKVRISLAGSGARKRLKFDSAASTKPWFADYYLAVHGDVLPLAFESDNTVR
jgi:hypothetical protein